MRRREFIKNSAGVAVALSYGSTLKADDSLASLLNPVSEIDLIAGESSHSLLAGKETSMLSFTGKTLSGSVKTLQQIPGFLGPVIEVNTGEQLKVNFTNNLSEPSIIHWHGLHLPEKQDGHPRYVIAPGETYNYQLNIKNRAGLYWYHPHPHGRTGYQVYMGLAGLFIVRDAEEKALNLPSGDNEILMVLQDRHFDENNQLIYIQSGHDIMMGKMGNTLFVNGGRDSKKDVKSESYRLRLLNGSNARSYRLQWDDGTPLTIIGNDGGLLSAPVERDSVLFSPGERLDIIVNFENKKMGDQVKLMSIPIIENPNASAFELYEFTVTEEGVQSFSVPSVLSKIEKIKPEEAVNYSDVKSFVLAPKQGVGWTIDGLPYEMDKVRPKETVKLGTTEIWEFDLSNSGMIHPIHIHGAQFQVLARDHGPYSKGLTLDDGWKDTVSLMPGDKVRVIKRFEDYAGTFLYHCHLLEHEDSSMMRNFLVTK